MLNSVNASKTDKQQMPTLLPMELGGILDSTLSLYRSNFRLFLKILAIYFILMALQEVGVVWLLEITNTPNLDNFISDVDSLLGDLAYMLCVGVIVIASSEIYSGRPITFQPALQRFRSQFLTYLGSSLLFLIPYTILTVDSIRMSTLRGLLILIAVPFLSAFYIRWIFYGPVILLEGFSSVQAFRRSADLVRGTWMRVCKITVAITLLEIGMYYILGHSFGTVLALLGIVGDGNLTETIGDLFTLKYVDIRPTSVDTSVMYLIYLGADTFTLPIHAIGVTLLYFDLRIRKEAFDIEMQARNIQDLM